MALFYMESCQGYGTGSGGFAQFYDFASPSFSTIQSGGRSGTNAFYINSISGNVLIIAKRSGSNRTSGVLGFAFQPVSYPTAYGTICSLIDAEFTSSWNYTTQIQVQTYGGNWRLVCGSTTLATTSGPVFTDNNWHYIELVATISTTTSGSASLWIDGVQVLSVTGVVTATSGNSFFNSVGFWGTGTSIHNLSDMYALDTTGSSPWNARLGDVKVLYEAATANGAINNFTPQAAAWAASTVFVKNAIVVDSNGNLQLATTGGTSGSGSHPTWNVTTGGTTSDGGVTWTNKGSPANWKYIVNLPPADAQAYLSDNTLNDEEFYQFGAFAAGLQPVAVGVTMRGWKDQTYYCAIQAVVNSGGTIVASGTDFPLLLGATNAFNGLAIFETDPNTGIQWASVAAVNSATYGVKVTAV